MNFSSDNRARFDGWELAALVVGIIVVVLISLFGSGCAENPQAKTEAEAAADARACSDNMDRIIFDTPIAPTRVAFCAEVQRRVVDLVKTDRACAAIYPKGPPDLCAKVLEKDGGS